MSLKRAALTKGSDLTAAQHERDQLATQVEELSQSLGSLQQRLKDQQDEDSQLQVMATVLLTAR